MIFICLYSWFFRLFLNAVLSLLNTNLCLLKGSQKTTDKKITLRFSTPHSFSAPVYSQLDTLHLKRKLTQTTQAITHNKQAKCCMFSRDPKKWGSTCLMVCYFWSYCFLCYLTAGLELGEMLVCVLFYIIRPWLYYPGLQRETIGWSTPLMLKTYLIICFCCECLHSCICFNTNVTLIFFLAAICLCSWCLLSYGYWLFLFVFANISCREYTKISVYEKHVVCLRIYTLVLRVCVPSGCHSSGVSGWISIWKLPSWGQLGDYGPLSLKRTSSPRTPSLFSCAHTARPQAGLLLNK